MLVSQPHLGEHLRMPKTFWGSQGAKKLDAPGQLQVVFMTTVMTSLGEERNRMTPKATQGQPQGCPQKGFDGQHLVPP
jgi:hypothetical protein